MQRFILSTSFHFIFRPAKASPGTFSSHGLLLLLALSSLSSCKYFYYNILSLLVFTASAWHCLLLLLLLLLLLYTLSFHFVCSRFLLLVAPERLPGAASRSRQEAGGGRRQCQSFVEHTIQCPAVVKRFILLLIRCKCATPSHPSLPPACPCPAGYDANNVMAAQGTRTLLCISSRTLSRSLSPSRSLLSALVLNINKHFAEIIEVL